MSESINCFVQRINLHVTTKIGLSGRTSLLIAKFNMINACELGTNAMIQIVKEKLSIYAFVVCIYMLCIDIRSANGNEILETILTRSFFIQNITIYCSQFIPDVTERSSGKYGDISRLTYHIRQEVVGELPADQSIFVVRRSADMARAGALQAIRQLYEFDRDREQARIVEWCEQSAALEIAEYVRDHDGRHDEFVAIIAAAKKGGDRSKSELKP